MRVAFSLLTVPCPQTFLLRVALVSLIHKPIKSLLFLWQSLRLIYQLKDFYFVHVQKVAQCWITHFVILNPIYDPHSVSWRKKRFACGNLCSIFHTEWKGWLTYLIYECRPRQRLVSYAQWVQIQICVKDLRGREVAVTTIARWANCYYLYQITGLSRKA